MAGTVGGRIRELRQRRAMSQSELVAGLSLSASYVSLIESGRRQPREQSLELIAERLGCSVEYLRTGRGSDGVEELELDLRFAELALRSGDPSAARERFAGAVGRAVGLRQDDAAVEARWGQGRAAEALGDLEGAIEVFERLAELPALPGTVSRTAVLMRLCRAYLQCGDLTRAIEIGETALAALRSSPGVPGDADEVAELASTLVGCYYERGDLTRAHVLARRVIAEAERTGSVRARAAAYWNAGVVAEARGDLRAARTFTERALALYGEGDNARAIGLLRLNCAWLLLRDPQPDHVAAAELLRRALDQLAEAGNPVDVASVETELARCHLLAGEPEDAVDVAGHAIDRLAAGPRLETARARIVLGDAQLAAGRVAEAMTAYAAAAQELTVVGAVRQAASAWRDLADALATLGRTEEAMAAYRHATDAAGIAGRACPPAPAATAAAPRGLRR